MNRDEGFTLIELLIVVAIIGILAAIAVPNFLNAQMRAKITRVRTDQKGISTALDMYRLDNGTYIQTMNGASEFFLLTTPIAYMGSVPPDIFLPGGSFGTVSRNSDDRFPTFDYTANDYYGKLKGHPQGFIMESVGPDRIHLHAIFEEWASHKGNPPPERFNRYIFDTSNGLASFGSIVRGGGEIKTNYNID